MTVLLKVFFTLLVISTTVVLGRGEDPSFTDAAGENVKVTMEAIGCYRSNKNNNGMPKMYYDARKKVLDWNTYPDFSAVIHACAREAFNNSVSIFGIQFFGECWSGPSVDMSAMHHSSACVNGVGMADSNFIYRMSVMPNEAACQVNGKAYSEGALMSVPNEWIDADDAKCLSCRCSGGEATDCTLKHYCDVKLMGGVCEKYEYATGACCPHCACVHNGVKKENGASWVKHNDFKCYHCSCDRDVARCDLVNCYCPEGEEPSPDGPPPDKCCPACVVKTTTSTPVYIKISTRRPAPTWPPFWGRK